MNNLSHNSKKGKHITFAERQTIEKQYKEGRSITEIATNISKDRSTVSKEIKLGMVTQLDSQYRYYQTYSADYAQSIHEQRFANKSHGLKIANNVEGIKFVVHLIKKYKMSFYSALIVANNEGYAINVCDRTLYNYLYSGHLTSFIDEKDLVRGSHKKKKKKQNARKRLIDISRDISSRTTLDGFEIDTVMSGRKKGECLLTFTHIETNLELIFKISGRTNEAVVNQINSIENRMTPKIFKEIFNQITSDNGSEFVNYEALEKSNKTNTPRTKIYYARPYHSWERGRNENGNGLIRRYYPKGKRFEEVKKEEITETQNILNNIPRKKFNGKSSYEVFKEGLEKRYKTNIVQKILSSLNVHAFAWT